MTNNKLKNGVPKIDFEPQIPWSPPGQKTSQSPIETPPELRRTFLRPRKLLRAHGDLHPNRLVESRGGRGFGQPLRTGRRFLE